MRHSYEDLINQTVSFGKYKGKTWDEISDIDPRYVLWASDNVKGVKLPQSFIDAVEMDLRDREEDYWCALEGWDRDW